MLDYTNFTNGSSTLIYRTRRQSRKRLSLFLCPSSAFRPSPAAFSGLFASAAGLESLGGDVLSLFCSLRETFEIGCIFCKG